MGAVIADVYPDSIASRLGLEPGDRIVTLNGEKAADLIQFQWAWAGEEVRLEVETGSGIKQHIIHKQYDEGPGIRFEQAVFDGVRLCANRCVFCFVDQMAPGCRESLYVKDDDYRLSFLQGSFITLTNLAEKDLQRIEAEKLSPLYVSVHATDPLIRSRLLGRKEPDRLKQVMARLGAAGIAFHCQIVLCPGYNDGDALFRTVEDLGRLKGVLSASVVPVGITRFRQGLPPLRQVGGAEAEGLIAWLEPVQKRYLQEKGTRFIWLSDEFYILAGQAPPQAGTYEDYPQWENGIGLVRGFLEEAGQCPLPEAVTPERSLFLAGATSPMKALAPLWGRLKEIKGLKLTLLPLENCFFGPTVNVSGLLTGKCLLQGLGQHGLPPGTAVYLPDVMLRDKGDRFIDGLTVSEVSGRLGLNLVFLPPNGRELLEKLLLIP